MRKLLSVSIILFFNLNILSAADLSYNCKDTVDTTSYGSLNGGFKDAIFNIADKLHKKIGDQTQEYQVNYFGNLINILDSIGERDGLTEKQKDILLLFKDNFICKKNYLISNSTYTNTNRENSNTYYQSDDDILYGHDEYISFYGYPKLVSPNVSARENVRFRDIVNTIFYGRKMWWKSNPYFIEDEAYALRFLIDFKYRYSTIDLNTGKECKKTYIIDRKKIRLPGNYEEQTVATGTPYFGDYDPSYVGQPNFRLKVTYKVTEGQRCRKFSTNREKYKIYIPGKNSGIDGFSFDVPTRYYYNVSGADKTGYGVWDQKDVKLRFGKPLNGTFYDESGLNPGKNGLGGIYAPYSYLTNGMDNIDKQLFKYGNTITLTNLSTTGIISLSKKFIEENLPPDGGWLYIGVMPSTFNTSSGEGTTLGVIEDQFRSYSFLKKSEYPNIANLNQEEYISSTRFRYYIYSAFGVKSENKQKLFDWAQTLDYDSNGDPKQKDIAFEKYIPNTGCYVGTYDRDTNTVVDHVRKNNGVIGPHQITTRLSSYLQCSPYGFIRNLDIPTKYGLYDSNNSIDNDDFDGIKAVDYLFSKIATKESNVTKTREVVMYKDIDEFKPSDYDWVNYEQNPTKTNVEYVNNLVYGNTYTIQWGPSQCISTQFGELKEGTNVYFVDCNNRLQSTSFKEFIYDNGKFKSVWDKSFCLNSKQEGNNRTNMNIELKKCNYEHILKLDNENGYLKARGFDGWYLYADTNSNLRLVNDGNKTKFSFIKK